MIAYINERLNDWARWQVSDRRLVRTLLGAHNCWPQMLGEAQSTATVRQRGTLVPLNDVECCETDRAVCALRAELKDPVIAYYTRVGTGEMLAKCLGISKRTLFYRIDLAHDEISRTLVDVARLNRADHLNKELHGQGLH